MQSDETTTILLVDDDEALRSRLARGFRERGFAVQEADEIRAVRAAIDARPPELAVVDLRLPSGSGLDIVREIKRLAPNTRIVVLTGYGSIATALDAVSLGATHYLQKPATIDDILAGFARSARSSEAVTTPEDDDVPSLERVEWEHINRVLSDTGGNVSEAARRLGLHRRSLQRKLAKYPSRR
jgi:two-component system response regulator RegA